MQQTASILCRNAVKPIMQNIEASFLTSLPLRPTRRPPIDRLTRAQKSIFEHFSLAHSRTWKSSVQET